MRQADSHSILCTLIFGHWQQPWLCGVQWQVVPCPLHRLEGVLYEIAADVEPLLRPTRWGRCT